jgi:hypothetical protein
MSHAQTALTLTCMFYSVLLVRNAIRSFRRHLAELKSFPDVVVNSGLKSTVMWMAGATALAAIPQFISI